MPDPFAQYVEPASDPFAAYAVADAKPHAPEDRGILAGMLNTVPTPSRIMDSIRQIPANINRAVSSDPIKAWTETEQSTPAGKMRNGQPREGLGETLGTLLQLGLGEAGAGFLRTRVAPKTVGTIPLGDLENARINGDTFTVGQGSRDVLANGRKQTGGQIRTTSQPPTRGNLALKPDAVQEPFSAPQRPDLVPVGGESAYNAAQPKPTNLRAVPTTPKEQVLSDLVSRPDIVRDAKAMQARAAEAKHPTVNETAPISVADVLNQPKFSVEPWHTGEASSMRATTPGVGSLTPEEVQAYADAGFGKDITDALSKELSQSPEARATSGAHRYDAESASRYRQMLQNQNGAISPALLKMMGAPARYGGAMWAAKTAGLPGWTGLAGMGAYDAVTANPTVSVQALRAALLARLAAGSGGNTPTTNGR